jgi:pimeloyl-ACP methyl ester carboxylesterase/DNA-binding CsgD family transcriptional regulator
MCVRRSCGSGVETACLERLGLVGESVDAEIDHSRRAAAILLNVEQRIRFCEAEGHRIAWSEVGSGPPLMLPSPWISNVHTDWENPEHRSFIERLAETHTVLRYDRPGTGLSDRALPKRPSLDHDIAILEALLAELDLGPTAFFGVSSGGCIATGFAARNPDLVSAMVLCGCYSDGKRLAPPEVRDSLVSVIRASWGLGARVLSDMIVPGGTPAEREAWAKVQRDSADADAAADLYQLVYDYDSTRALDHVTAPTLVIHRRDDAAVPFKLGRELASRLPSSRFVPLEGTRHLPWQGDTEPIVELTLEFLEAHQPAPGDPTSTSPEAAEAPPTAPAPRGLNGPVSLPDLSPREVEVLKLVGEGLSDREIAERLVLSPHTVHRHVANVRTKLGQPSRAAAAAYATRLELI